jgi:hypothetical protein
MANTAFTFTNSKIFEPEEDSEVSFLCNDLVEKKRYIYFRHGPFETDGTACGSDMHKMPKDLVKWELIGDLCENGNAIWKVEQLDNQ